MTQEKAAVEKQSKVSGVALRADNQTKPHGAAYRWMIDTAATLTFSIPLGMANNTLVGHMGFVHAAGAVGFGALMSIPTSRPYGIIMGHIFKLFRTYDSSRPLRKAAVDTAAVIGFFLPANIPLYYMFGGKTEHLLPWTGVFLASCVVTARPYGIWLTWLRRKAGVPQDIKKSE